MDGPNRRSAPIFIDLTLEDSTSVRSKGLDCSSKTLLRKITPHDKTPYDRPNKVSKSQETSIEDCPICMESLRDRKVIRTPCKHVFCALCLKELIDEKESLKQDVTCPICRKKPSRQNLILIKEILYNSVIDLTGAPKPRSIHGIYPTARRSDYEWWEIPPHLNEEPAVNDMSARNRELSEGFWTSEMDSRFQASLSSLNRPTLHSDR